MRRWLAARLAQAAGVVLLVATLVFVLVHLAPGDPFSAMLDDPHVNAAVRAHWRAEFGLDQSLGVQYLRWLASVARGNLGWSISLNLPVSRVLADALPNSLLLMGVALAGSFAIGIGAGVFAARRHGRPADRLVRWILVLVHSVPDFWLALMALLVFAVRLGLFPVGGTVDAVGHDYMGPGARAWDRLHHLLLPATLLMLMGAVTVARFQRAAMLDVARDDYVRTARAKGLSERDVTRHAFRNALLPVITVFGLAFPALVAGAFFVERIFAWPGMGYVIVRAIATRDYHLVTAGTVVVAAMVAAGALLADLLHAAADPRLRRA